MYERAHSGAAGQHALREDLRRLEATLDRCERELPEARRLQGVPGAEMLARTAKLLVDEIERLRKLLV
jgi:hypothetical protein